MAEYIERDECSNEKELSEDIDFLLTIITQICNYSVKNNMLPDETIKTISESMLSLLKISSFNGWRGEENGRY